MTKSDDVYAAMREIYQGMSAAQLQNAIASITMVARGHVPIQICDAEFAYHWYRYITRLEYQARKSPNEDTARLLFEMFSHEDSSEDRCEILRAAHRELHLKLIPPCGLDKCIIVQHTSRVLRAGIVRRDGIYAVTLTVYQRIDVPGLCADAQSPERIKSLNEHNKKIAALRAFIGAVA